MTILLSTVSLSPILLHEALSLAHSAPAEMLCDGRGWGRRGPGFCATRRLGCGVPLSAKGRFRTRCTAAGEAMVPSCNRTVNGARASQADGNVVPSFGCLFTIGRGRIGGVATKAGHAGAHVKSASAPAFEKSSVETRLPNLCASSKCRLLLVVGLESSGNRPGANMPEHGSWGVLLSPTLGIVAEARSLGAVPPAKS